MKDHPCSIPALGVIIELSLFAFYSALRGLSPVFPSPQTDQHLILSSFDLQSAQLVEHPARTI